MTTATAPDVVDIDAPIDLYPAFDPTAPYTPQTKTGTVLAHLGDIVDIVGCHYVDLTSGGRLGVYAQTRAMAEAVETYFPGVTFAPDPAFAHVDRFVWRVGDIGDGWRLSITHDSAEPDNQS